MDEAQRQLIAQLFNPEAVPIIEAWCRTCATAGAVHWMYLCLLSEIREHWGEFGGPEEYPDGRPEDLELLERFRLAGVNLLPFAPPPERCPDCGGSIRHLPLKFTLRRIPLQQLECQACNWWTRTRLPLQRQNQLNLLS